MQNSADCPERHRLARKLAHAVAAVYELKDRERKAGKANDKTVSILLDQARTAERNVDGDFLFCGVVLPLFFHAFSPLS